MAAEYVSFKVDKKTNTILQELALKENITKSALIRKLLKNSIRCELPNETVDFVRQQINEEIKTTCFPQFERIAKLMAKIGYQSVADFYLSAYIMDSILPDSKKRDFQEIKEMSKKMAISYLKLTPEEFSEFSKNEDIALEKLGLR